MTNLRKLAKDQDCQIRNPRIYIARRTSSMNKDKQYLQWATTIAKEASCGAVKIDRNGAMCAYSNDNGEYAYIRCIKDKFPYNDGSTLYLTHGVNSRNAMKIVDAGIKRVVFIKEFGIGVGTALLRSQGVEAVQCEVL